MTDELSYEQTKSGIKTQYARYVSDIGTGILFIFFVAVYTFPMLAETLKKIASNPSISYCDDKYVALFKVLYWADSTTKGTIILGLAVAVFFLIPVIGRLITALTYTWPFLLIVGISERKIFDWNPPSYRVKQLNQFERLTKKSGCYKNQVSYENYILATRRGRIILEKVYPSIHGHVITTDSTAALFRSVGAMVLIFVFFHSQVVPFSRAILLVGIFIGLGFLALSGSWTFLYHLRIASYCLELGIFEPPNKAGKIRITEVARQRVQKELKGDLINNK